MIGVPIAPRRVFGVVLGTGADAGAGTWVCRAHPGTAGIRLESVESLARLPGGASEAGPAFRALVGKVLDAPRSAWGFDFPFGLPVTGDEGRSSGQAREGWRARLRAVAAAEGPADVAVEDPGRLRRTDEERRLPAPLTAGRRDLVHTGMGQVLSRLHGQPGVLVLPIDSLPILPEGTPPAMASRAPSTYLLEVAPSCTLRALQAHAELPLPGAGETVPTEPAAREELVRALVGAGWVRPVPRGLRRRAASEPAALAAVLAAVGAWRGYRGSDHGALHHDDRYGSEGYVYC